MGGFGREKDGIGLPIHQAVAKGGPARRLRKHAQGEALTFGKARAVGFTTDDADGMAEIIHACFMLAQCTPCIQCK